MARLLILLPLLLMSSRALAQPIWQGRVEDATTGQPLVGATLTAADGFGTVSDKNGKFLIEGLQSGQWIEVRFLGFETRRIILSDEHLRLTIALQPLSYELHGVTVSAFESGRPLLLTAGSVAVLSGAALRPAQNLSLAPALNSIAGVRMEESGYGGSSRISIRGSLLRSPFGIRNVKIYWNDIPLTDPGGASSRFNSLDAADLGRIEVIKGPAGSMYGSGTGGVLIMRSRRPDPDENGVTAEFTGGAFALARSSLGASWTEGDVRLRLNYIDQSQRGYREHQRVDKQSLQLSAGITMSDRRNLGLNVFHYDGTYQLPGPLTAVQILDKPRMAIPFSKANDARVSLRTTGLAVSQRYLLSPAWENTSSLGLIVQDKENPSGTSPAFNQFEISSFYGLSTRSVFRYQSQDDYNPWSVQFGIEAQTSFSLEKYYANTSGQPGVMRSDAEVDASTWSIFAQSEKEIAGKWILTAGFSFNGTRYDVVDRLGELGLAGSADFRFGPTLAPRVALIRKLGDYQSVHASLSYGFSPPTQWEVKTLAGVNKDLRPEHGSNTEIGWKAQSMDRKWTADVSLYYFGLKGALLPQYTADELPFFANTGETKQWGAEGAVSATLIDATLYGLRLWGAGAWNDYRFGDYISQVSTAAGVEHRDYSGNRMPGIAKWSGSLGLDARLPAGFSIAFTGRYQDTIPIDDANAVNSKSWFLVSSRLDGTWGLGRRFRAGLRLGVENMTNRYWDNLLALNGSAGRYFNPGPPRHLYVQAKFSVKL